jgi:TonB family protein
MKQLSKEKKYGIIGTLLFHVVLILILYFVAMDRPVIEKREKFVELGSVEDAQGNEFLEKIEADKQTVPKKSVEPVSPKVKENLPVKDPYITQKEESLKVDSVDVKSERKKDELTEEQKREIAEKRRLDAEKKRIAEEQRQKELEAKKNEEEQQEKNAQTSNLFAQSQKMSSEGGDGPGTAGGEEPAGAGKGADKGNSSASGTRPSFDLAGRKSVILPQPESRVNRSCTVVVKILVSPEGKVIDANVDSRGVTAEAAALNAALSAARRSTFSKSSGVDNQAGTITYHFIVK